MGIIYYFSGRVLWLVFLDLPGGVRTLQRRRQDGGLHCEMQTYGHDVVGGMNELTAAVVTCTRPIQAQSSQHPSVDRRDMLATPHSLQKSL